MPSLVYAPEISVRIWSTVARSVIDVSEDISEATVTRTLGPSVSTLNLNLINGGRKYDGLFTPMDRFVVYLRRLKPMLLMSGYLDDVPILSISPGSVSLSGSCTLKLLQNFYWDPGTAAARGLFESTRTSSKGDIDGGIARRTIDLLSKVAGWDEGRVHLGGIPRDWFDRLAPLADRVMQDANSAEMALSVGSDGFIQGVSPTIGGSTKVQGIGPGTGTLPATHGKASWFGGPNGEAYGNFALTGEPGRSPKDDWFCAMRWPYVTETLQSVPGVNVGQAKSWWANRRILVTNPRTNRSVVVRAADWGPNVKTGRVIDLSHQALTALGITTDDKVTIAFADGDPKSGPLGPARQGASVTDLVTSGVSAGSGNATGLPTPMTSGWGNHGDSSNMRTITVRGLTFTCHRLAVDRFAGFISDLIDQLGYTPKVVGGYNDRKIAGSSTYSNHAWGAAIDIDPERNPRYGASGGAYALPHTEKLVQYARKWGLYWGGEYKHSKDYMHFEVIGAPSTDPNVPSVVPATGGFAPKWQTPVAKPYKISAHFGDGGDRWAKGHSGTDFAVPEYTTIRPVGPGVVHAKGTGDPSYGNWVSIDHGSKVYTFYAHMHGETPLSVGDAVDETTTLGAVGQTGNASGPHVHLELRLDADTYDAALASGGIEKYVLGGATPPRGVGGFSASGVGETGTEGGAMDLSSVGGGLLNAYLWMQSGYGDIESLVLTGYRALMNDEPIMNTVSEYLGVGMRDFCSAPNGDFIGWFPDYFGHYKMAGKMVINPMEIDGVFSPPQIRWSDANLKTHQFVTGTTFGSLEDDSSNIVRKMHTAGIASVEFPEMLHALLNVTKDEAKAMSKVVMGRYGARPESKAIRSISGAEQEFYFACMEFMKNWGEQFRTSIHTAFMPEVYPGMLACFPAYGIQGYVREVTHTINLGEGGGFATSISASPWSTMGNQSIAPALPKGAPL